MIYAAHFKGFNRKGRPQQSDLITTDFGFQRRHRSKNKPRIALIGDGKDKPTIILIENGKIDPKCPRQQDRKGPRAIMFTCKQLYVEVVEVYTKYTQFFIHDAPALERFSPFIKSHITDLCICKEMLLCRASCWRLFHVLNSMERLKVLTFSSKMWEHVFELSCPLRNLRGLRDLRLDDIKSKGKGDMHMIGISIERTPHYTLGLKRSAREKWEKKILAEGRRFKKQVTGPRAEQTLPVLELPFAQTGLSRLDVKTRMRIYALVLVKDDKCGDPFEADVPLSLLDDRSEPTFMNDPDRPHHVFHSPQARKPSPLNILLVCRQIYEEAYSVFYNNNGFTFRTTTSFGKFLKAIGKARRHELVDVEICNMGPIPGKEDFHLLPDCHKLERLRLQIWRSCVVYWTSNPYLRGLRDLKSLLIQDLDDERDERCRRRVEEPPRFWDYEAPWITIRARVDEENVERKLKSQKAIQEFGELVTGPHDSVLTRSFLSPTEKSWRDLFQKTGQEKGIKCEMCCWERTFKDGSGGRAFESGPPRTASSNP